MNKTFRSAIINRMKENIGKHIVMKEEFSNEPWYSSEVYKIINIMGSVYVIDRYIYFNDRPEDTMPIDKVRILTTKEMRSLKIDNILKDDPIQ